MSKGRATSNSLVLLDLSVVFDTIDHNILLHRNANHISGFDEIVLKWVKPYLSSCTQTVKIFDSVSDNKLLLYGLLKDPGLGPLLSTQHHWQHFSQVSL